MKTAQQLWIAYHASVVAGSPYDNAPLRNAFMAGALLAFKEANINGPVTLDFLAPQAREHISGLKLFLEQRN